MLKNRVEQDIAIKKSIQCTLDRIGFFKPTYGSKTLYISIYGGNIRMTISKLKLIESIYRQ